MDSSQVLNVSDIGCLLMAIWHQNRFLGRTIIYGILLLATKFVFPVSRISAQTTAKTLRVSEIRVTGNSVFDDAEIRNLVQNGLKGKLVRSIDDLDFIRQMIDDYYIQQGYINSGSLIIPQEIGNGIVEIAIIEGLLDSIEVKGTEGLSESYIKSQLPPEGKPLNINEILESLNRLESNSLVKRLKAQLVSKGGGKNVLLIDLEENDPATFLLEINNEFSPSIGSYGGKLQFNHQNLFGYQDRLTIDRIQTEGSKSTGISYSLPINDGRLTLGYNNASSEIIEEEIENFDIRGDFQSFVVDFQQPVFEGSNDELALGFAFKYIDSETFILKDFSFAFVDGLDNGKSTISAFQFYQTYQRKRGKTSLVLRSQFNMGLDVFDATRTNAGIDGIFSSWQGAAQYFSVLDDQQNAILTFRLNAQLTPDQLLPAEQISMGGRKTVRGYRRNLAVADNGVIANLETIFSLVKDDQWGNVSLVPFLDGGMLWNNDRKTTGDSTFLSAGIGWRYRLSNLFEARIDYAFPLVEINGYGATETEDNLSFSLFVEPFSF